jgi:hypothetical protein
MGTSQASDTSGARLPGPRGRPDRLSRQAKTSKSPFGFKWETGNFCPGLTRGYRTRLGFFEMAKAGEAAESVPGTLPNACR